MMIHKIGDEVYQVQDNHHKYRVAFLKYVDNDARTFDDLEIRHVRRDGRLGRFIDPNGARGKAITTRAQKMKQRKGH